MFSLVEALWVDVEANMESAMNAIDKSEYAFVRVEEGSMDGATHCYNTRKHDSRVSGVRLVAKKALGSGESHDMNTQVRWSGRFWQGGEANEMWFNHMIMDQNGIIKGNGSDAVGQFNIAGNCSSNGNCEINKQYHGAHIVYYRGQMDNQGWIKGNWEIPGNCDGTFELKVDQPNWAGFFMQGGNRTDMQFGLCISGSSVTGNGCDSVGAFSVSGRYDQGSGDIDFTKYYYGAHSVNYKGKQHKEHGNDVIRGDWCIPGNCSDKFELTMHH